MTTAASKSRTSLPRHGFDAAGGATLDELPPFVAPTPSHRIADAPARARVILRGRIVDVEISRWVGGLVLEVTVSDGSSSICLVFLGRRGIAGIEPGRELTATGTVGRRLGRPIVLNPRYWLHAPLVEVADA
jgi:hypothetical protein